MSEDPRAPFPWWRLGQLSPCWGYIPPARRSRSPVPQPIDSPCRTGKCHELTQGRGCPPGSRGTPECMPSQHAQALAYPGEAGVVSGCSPYGCGERPAPTGYFPKPVAPGLRPEPDWRLRGGKSYAPTFEHFPAYVPICDACGGFCPGEYPGKGPEDYGGAPGYACGDVAAPSGQVGNQDNDSFFGALFKLAIVAGAFGAGYLVGRK